MKHLKQILGSLLILIGIGLAVFGYSFNHAAANTITAYQSCIPGEPLTPAQYKALTTGPRYGSFCIASGDIAIYGHESVEYKLLITGSMVFLLGILVAFVPSRYLKRLLAYVSLSKKQREKLKVRPLYLYGASVALLALAIYRGDEHHACNTRYYLPLLLFFTGFFVAEIAGIYTFRTQGKHWFKALLLSIPITLVIATVFIVIAASAQQSNLYSCYFD